MGKIRLLLIMLFAGITASAQVSFDSLKRSIKSVNVQKAVGEDHARLIAEFEGLEASYNKAVEDFWRCRDEKDLVQYELNLYRLLEHVEQKDFGKIKNLSLKQSTSIELDTTIGGALQNMTITFKAINTTYDSGALKLGVPLEIKIANNDAWLQRFYPYMSSLLTNGIILVKIKPLEIVAPNQVLRLTFPRLIVQGNTNNKKKYAADFLNCIRTVCNDPQMFEYNFADYIRLERTEVPIKTWISFWQSG